MCLCVCVFFLFCFVFSSPESQTHCSKSESHISQSHMSKKGGKSDGSISISKENKAIDISEDDHSSQDKVGVGHSVCLNGGMDGVGGWGAQKLERSKSD